MVPLIVTQAASPRVDGWKRDDPALVLWTMTPVEVTSAVRRLVREGALDVETATTAEARTDELVAASHLVIDVEAVKMQARRLLRLHALRAADALQLAAALEWSEGRPAGRVVHTLDDRLAQAARLEGFLVPAGE